MVLRLVNHLCCQCQRFCFSQPKHLNKTTQSIFASLCTLTPYHTTSAKRNKTFSHIFQQCSEFSALNPGKQAHALMIVTGFIPTVFVSNCLIHMYVKCSHMDNAVKMFDKMCPRDTVSWNTMIFGYAACHDLGMARWFFDTMPEKDVVSWNSMISAYLQGGDNHAAIDVFMKMRELAQVPCDQTTFSVVLKVCSGLGKYVLGLLIHSLVIRMGLDKDVVTGSALVDMYAKCKDVEDAIQVFNAIPDKNWVCWSAAIAGCAQNDQFIEGLEIFKDMQRAGIGVSQSTYASTLRSCAGLSAIKLGSQLHAHALKADFGSDVIVGTAILDMYVKCDSLYDAQKLFNSLSSRGMQSYNAIIIGYARQNHGLEALKIFQSLQESGLGFDGISLSGAFSACAAIKGHMQGVQLHGLAIKSNYMSNICVANAILDMYGKCEALSAACAVFDEMVNRDAVSWNALIAAHEQNDEVEGTLSLFVSMLYSGMEPDDFTFGSVIKACAGQQALSNGMEIHGRIIKSGMGLDSFVGSALVDMYGKCGMLQEAGQIHDRIERTTVSWNTFISGFSLQKQSEEAQRCFLQMLETGVNPDNFTYAALLDTCANLATVGTGKQIHAQVIKLQLKSDVYISSTLLDMYSKCGHLHDCHVIFEKAPKRDYVTWNAMICAYAYHGLGDEAIKIFENMLLANVSPNHATFVSVLRACAHMGYLSKGSHYFEKMQSLYGLEPQLEHYSCMVDLLGRAGQVKEALKLIQDMPFEADAVMWRTLLSICKINCYVEVAEIAANSLLQLDPQDSSAYVLLSNIYANAGMWGEVSRMRRIMKNSKLRKEPGCSWVEVKDEVHAFLIGDKAHPRCEEIYGQIDMLIAEMKWIGYKPETDLTLDEEVDECEQQEELKISTRTAFKSSDCPWSLVFTKDHL